jgi:hypothetical protein
MVTTTKRRVSLERYVVAGIITFLIFILGLSLGFILDYKRVTWIEETSKEQELDYKSLQLQYLYLNTLENTEKSCDVLSNTLRSTLITLSETLNDLEEFKKNTKLNKKEYKVLLRKFTIENLNYWLFAEKSKKSCNMNAISILYFFSRDNCDICPNQGIVLSYFKSIFGEDLLIFPIDTDLKEEEPIISLLESVYDVTSYPTLIIEEKPYRMIVPRDELGKIICNLYKTERSDCERYL